MKVFLVSGSGFLGSTLAERLPVQGFGVLGTSRRVLDLALPVKDQLGSWFEKERFEAGILCAAITDVDQCFKEPERSRRVNVEAMFEILSIFRISGVKPVFFSSDLVFDGRRGECVETDLPSPSTLYGRQKLQVEEVIRSEFEEYLIFRTSKLMSMGPHPRSIITSIVDRLRKQEPVRAFVDQKISPVFVEDVARMVGRALERGASGIFHLASREILSRYELAVLISERLGLAPKRIEPIRATDFPWSEPRGLNHTLNAEKISAALGLQFTSVSDGLSQLNS